MLNCVKTIECGKESAFLYKFGQYIYKLDMPPINSIFFVENNGKWYFIDAGKNVEDIKNFVLPAFEILNIKFENVEGVLITHSHWDHTDGLPELLSLCKNAEVYAYAPFGDYNVNKVRENDVIDNLFKVVGICGHSADSVGFIDTRSNTLFSGDAIQLYGIKTCGMYIFGGVKNYINSHKKLLEEKIENILASHPYSPNGAFAFGEEEAKKHISDSIFCITELIDFTKEMFGKGVTEIQTIKAEFIKQNSKIYPDFPTDGFESAIESIIETYI